MTTRRLHRRDLLSGFAMLGAAASLPRSALAQSASPTTKLGAIEITVLSDGALTVPLSFILPETPPAEVAALLTAHGLPPSGVPSPTNCTLVKTGTDLVLIDAGSGANFQPTAGKLGANLEAAGIDPATIAKVVLTHAHPDHLWGVIDELDDARFPNATYVLSQAEWDFWADPDTAGRMPEAFQGMAAGTARVLKRIAGKVERRKAGEAVAPGLTYVDSAGHTPGHMAVMVESGRERLLVGGDVLSHFAVSFAKPEWPIGADLDRDQAIRTRLRLLDRLATDKTPLIGFHLPFPGRGYVERSGTAYRFAAA